MRFKMIVISLFVMSLSVFASTSGAQSSTQNLPSQAPPTQSGPGQRPMGPGMMTPDMMQMMGRMSRPAEPAGGRGPRAGGPLQMFSRLLTALDDTRVRTMLGLTDQQADSLRKTVVDTEIFTIKTGADIAVDGIDLRELLRADKPDRAAVMAKGDEISKFTSQLINRYLEAALAAKAVLTPEQQKMIRAYMERGAPALPAPPARP